MRARARRRVAGLFSTALRAACLVALPTEGTLARAEPAPQGEARLKLGPAPTLAFARASKPRAFELPKDHGPHFEFQTEWWYYTGNLTTEDGRRFGFQLTFFRRGLSPEPPPATGLATNQIYFAHFAVADVSSGRHHSAERFSRGAAGLAAAVGEPFRVFVEDWSSTAIGKGGADAGPERASDHGSAVRVTARDGDVVLDLELRATKPLVTHGDRGLSLKSDEPGNASYYIGFTRMAARGRIGTDGRGAAAAGEAWFDHEWSTSALGPKAVGWDWFSLQLADGRELMHFEIRRSDGSREPASSGTLVARDGRTRRLASADVFLEVLTWWTSPHSQARYPARWRLRVPTEELVLEIEPRLPDQEMRTSFVYWEGAVGLRGTSRGVTVEGQGYVEMTGYERSMQGVF